MILWLAFQPAFLSSSAKFESLAPDYSNQVRSLVAGQGFGSFRYPPLFPLMLAGVELTSSRMGIDDGILGATLFLVFAISGSLLVMRIGQELWGPWAGLLCAAVWLGYPVFWRMWLQPLSEAPFTVLLLAAVLVALGLTRNQDRSSVKAILVGVLLGLAMLVRPSAIGLPLVFGLFVVVRAAGRSRYRRAASATLIVLAAVVTVLPWEFHVWRSSGEVVPLSTGGVPTVLDGLTYAVDPSENRPVWVPDAVRQLQIEMYEKSYRELDSVAAISGFLWEKLRSTPAAVVQLFAIKAARSWYGTDSGQNDKWLLAFQLPLVTLLSIGAVRAWRSGGKVGDAGALILMIALYSWVMTTLVLSIVRYMVPALAVMVVAVPALSNGYPKNCCASV